MVGYVEAAGKEKETPECVWMTVGVSDGSNLYAVRYASDGDAPTLFHSRYVESVYKSHPDLPKKFDDSTRFVVSEPAGEVEDLWVEVPQSSCLRVGNGKLEIMPFRPASS